MNKLLIILSSVSSSITSSTSSEPEQVTPNIYPIGEAIFYYCLFVVVVVLFIFYILKRGSDSKVFFRQFTDTVFLLKKVFPLITVLFLVVTFIWSEKPDFNNVFNCLILSFIFLSLLNINFK